jgi:hypothetical protein
MKRSEFNKIVDERIDQIRSTLQSKAEEYATDGSAFYNFERSAEISRSTPKVELWGMAKKHLVSVIDLVESDSSFSQEHINEKIGDLINYLILLEGILKKKECCGNWTDTGECRDWCK